MCTPRPALVVGHNADVGDRLVQALRHPSYVAVWLDACRSALEMLGVVECAVVFILIEDAADWGSCRRIVRKARCPVAVVTQLRASGRRYRRRAFRLGAAACVSPSASSALILEVLDRILAGERRGDFTGKVRAREYAAARRSRQGASPMKSRRSCGR